MHVYAYDPKYDKGKNPPSYITFLPLSDLLGACDIISINASYDINNKPLISYTVEQALNSKVFDYVVVSTDSQTIADKAKVFGAERCFIRSKYTN